MDDNDRHEAWRAVLAGALAGLTGGEPADGYGPLISYRLGGPDPLEFVATLRREEPEPHWLFVTHGFSEPSADASTDSPSGYGFELCLRIPRAADDMSGEAPSAYVVLLQTLGRYVFETGSVFADGDYSALETGAQCLGGLAGLAFVGDRELGTIETPFGSIAFRSVIGLAPDELEAVVAWTTSAFIDLAVAAGKLSANHITRPGRPSFLTDSMFKAEVVAGGARDGSKTGHLYLPEMSAARKKRLLRTPSLAVTFDGHGLSLALSVLPNRIRFQKSLTLIGSQSRLRFDPADALTLEGDAEDARVGLTEDAATRIVRAFAAGAKQYSFDEIPLMLALGST